MKAGKSLQELAIQLEENKNNMRDFIAPSNKIEALTNTIQAHSNSEGFYTEGIGLHLENHGYFPVNRVCNAQLSQRLQIPKPYYDRMLNDSPALLCKNVNHWLEASDKNRLIRTLNGDARACLSDRYRALDNHDLAEAVLPAIIDAGCEVKSCEITDTRMYIKAISYKRTADIKVGDTVAAGVLVSNSEVGYGSLFAGLFTERLVCNNGMIHNDWSKRKYHIGRTQKNEMELNNAWELFTDHTKELSDRAFWSQVQDTVRGILSSDGFEMAVNSMREAAEVNIDGDPIKVVEASQKKFQLSESEKDSVLTHLINGHDLSKWGLANAITRTAEDVREYDRATEMEGIGWQVVELPQRQWEALGAE